MTLAQRCWRWRRTEFFLRDSGKLNQGELKIGAVGPFHVIEMVAAYRAATRHAAVDPHGQLAAGAARSGELHHRCGGAGRSV
jgi:hypothetical protein